MTTTISPPIRILALVGALAVLGLGLLLYSHSRSSSSSSATPVTPLTKMQTRHATATLPHTTKPKVAPKIVLLPGLPGQVAHALRYSKVVVVSLYAAGATGDRDALAQARDGAASARVGFAAVNVLNEQTARILDAFAGTTSTPTVLIVKRPGRIVNRFAGYADVELVAQAAQNVGR